MTKIGNVMNKYCLQKWRMALDSLIMSRLGVCLREFSASWEGLVISFLIKYQEYELNVQNSLVYSCLTYLKIGLIGAHCFWGSWGRAAGSKCCAFKGGEKKNSLALWSLRSSVVLVTPNFRENHTEEGGEGENNAIFPGNHFCIYGFLKRNIAINAR